MPALPNAGKMPALPDAGKMPAVPDAGKMPALPDAGRMPAVPDAAVADAALRWPDELLFNCFEIFLDDLPAGSGNSLFSNR